VPVYDCHTHYTEYLQEPPMPDAVIISTARTPIGRAFRGAFNMTHGAVLGGHVVKHAVARAGVEPGESKTW
jgi:acetyl-CoA acetyltransferase